METTTTTATARHLPFVVGVFIGDYPFRTLAQFSYESDALTFARAYFAGDNGGDVLVQNSDTNKISACSSGGTWCDLSEGARTQGFNG